MLQKEVVCYSQRKTLICIQDPATCLWMYTQAVYFTSSLHKVLQFKHMEMFYAQHT